MRERSKISRGNHWTNDKRTTASQLVEEARASLQRSAFQRMTMVQRQRASLHHPSRPFTPHPLGERTVSRGERVEDMDKWEDSTEMSPPARPPPPAPVPPPTTELPRHLPRPPLHRPATSFLRSNSSSIPGGYTHVGPTTKLRPASARQRQLRSATIERPVVPTQLEELARSITAGWSTMDARQRRSVAQQVSLMASRDTADAWRELCLCGTLVHGLDIVASTYQPTIRHPADGPPELARLR